MLQNQRTLPFPWLFFWVCVCVCVSVCAYTSELGESTSEEFENTLKVRKWSKVESFKEEEAVSAKLYQDN